MQEWKKFNKETITNVHGDMYYYRQLYNGEHAKIFPRAKNLIEKGEIIDVLEYGQAKALNVRTPYQMLNICKMVVDVPSIFASRSIQDIKTNHPADEEITNKVNTENAEHIEGTVDGTYNSEVIDLQQETIDQIIKNSNIDHKMNMTQLQIDGGIVSAPIKVNGQYQIQFKERNVYYPHDDGRGYDLVYELQQTEEEKESGTEYVHVYTEFEETDRLIVLHRLYSRNKAGELKEVTDESFVKERLGLDEHTNLYDVFVGRKRSFIAYLAYSPMFNNRLGVSALRGLEGRQEEVNWTLTRNAQTFERNGKPRISVTSEIMSRLKEMASQQYGDENKIDHRWLEITEMNEQGASIQVHQIDIKQIGDSEYVKDIIRGMLAETQTSEGAIEFIKDTANNQSGIAKFYDLIVSIIKSEEIRKRYIEFLKESFENVLWLVNKENPDIIIEQPDVIVDAIIPTPEQENAKENIDKFTGGVQSLDETVRQINPDKSEEWIKEELERLESKSVSQDSMSISMGNQTLKNFLNNRDDKGEPLNDDGTPVNPDDNSNTK